MAWESLHLPAGRQGAVWYRRNNGLRWPRHHHDELELNLVVRGHSTYLVRDRRVDLPRHTLVALFPDQEHLLIQESPECCMWVMVFTPALVTRIATGARHLLASRDPQVEARWRVDANRIRALDGLCRAVTLADSDDSANAGLAALLYAAWDAIAASPPGEPGAVVHPAIEDAVQRLRADPSLDGASLARLVGLSRARLSRLFSSQVRMPLSEFRSRLRLTRTLDLLQDRDLNLLEAALAGGFGSYAQFHRVVRDQLGMSPRDLLLGRQSPPLRPRRTSL